MTVIKKPNQSSNLSFISKSFKGKQSSGTATGSGANSNTSPHLNDNQDVNSMFKKTEIIGRGKFGIVYKGYNIQTKKVCAIKVLNLDSDEDEIEDVQREIQFLASLKQLPNVTHYYGSYLKNTSLWIIMEYCAGGSLRSLLRIGRIEEKYIGVIMRELLVALKGIHKENIIHRDIKAANVLISNDGSVKLCDFGVAAQLTQARVRRQTMAGTPYWMAPEVIIEGAYYDTKVDIWSLGITAYEIATGNPPYCEVEAVRAMQLITKSKPPRLESRYYSPLLKEFIALCLDEDPNARPTADELLKTKFIKTYKPLPTSILKELISSYLLYRDKVKKENTLAAAGDAAGYDGNVADGQNNKIENVGQEEGRKDQNVNEKAEVGSDDNEATFDVKWDFDSLNSTDYIVENNINVDAIQANANEWEHNNYGNYGQHNYSYQDEEGYSYELATNNGRTYAQGSTIGRAFQGSTKYTSVANGPGTHQYVSGNYQTKVLMATSNSNKVNTNNKVAQNSYMMTTRMSETRAPRQLLDLFEGTEGNTDDNLNSELKRSRNAIPGPILEQPLGGVTNTIDLDEAARVRPSISRNNSYSHFGQIPSSLPRIPPSLAVTSAPTSVEIEIPDELPTKSRHHTEANVPRTKPRSSTVSVSPLAYKQGGIAVGVGAGTGTGTGVGGGASKKIAISGTGIPSDDRNNPQHNASGFPLSHHIDGKKVNANNGSNMHAGMVQSSLHVQSGSNGSTESSVISSFNSYAGPLGAKSARNTPSPSTQLSITDPNTASPSRLKPVYTSHGLQSMGTNTTTGTPHMVPMTMKAVAPDSIDKDLLLHPMNNAILSNNPGASSGANSSHGKTQDQAKNADDFRRANLNLKLQMPLPTPSAGAKILDGNSIVVPTFGDSNINQFGVNTNIIQSIGVSMTPISERNAELGSRPTRTHSMTRRNKLNEATSNSTGPDASGSGTTATFSGLGNDGDTKGGLGINVAAPGQGDGIEHHHVAGSGAQKLVAQALGGGPLHSGNSSQLTLSTAGSSGSSIGSMVGNGTNSTIMAPPPASLQMDMFHDMDILGGLPGERRHVDRKPQVLRELNLLLQMFEDGLPVLKSALKEQLASVQETTGGVGTVASGVVGTETGATGQNVSP